MKKRPKKHFTGDGPFSERNPFTTEIRETEAVGRLGIGGDASRGIVNAPGNREFTEGVQNYQRIATDPNYGKDQEE